MKAGEKRKVETIRMITAGLKDRDIEARGQGKTIGDEDILGLLQKMVKSRQDASKSTTRPGAPTSRRRSARRSRSSRAFCRSR